MEWKNSAEKLEAYKACARQAVSLPNCLQGVTDYFGKNHSPQFHALAYVLHIAREDFYLSIDHLAELNKYVRALPYSNLKEVELEEV